VVLAPYIVSCAVAFGDPFHAVNAHTGFYRLRQGLPATTSINWLQFIRESQSPRKTLDTLLVGLTLYPFENKWNGLDYMIPGLGSFLAVAAVLALLVWAIQPVGRMLLLLLVTSLAPYAFTWEILGGGEWRFTLHSYPLYLVASACLLVSAARLIRPGPTSAHLRWRTLVRHGVIVIAIAVAIGGLLIGSRAMSIRDTLASGGSVTIMSGMRDAPFLGSGWSLPMHEGNTVQRETRASVAHLQFPLAGPSRCNVLLRVSPACPTSDPLTVDVLVNGRPFAQVEVPWRDKRMGRTDIRVPAAATRAGTNTVSLRPEPRPENADRCAGRLRLWYFSFQPSV
jgi:hypothetical protein